MSRFSLEAATREAGGSAEQVLAAIAQELNPDGTYVVVVGDQFRAASTVLESAGGRNLADDAFRESRDQGVAAVLLSFVDAVGEERNGGGGDGGSLGGALIPLGLAGAAIAFFVLRRRRRSAENNRELAEVKTTARDDLVALGEYIGTVDRQRARARGAPGLERALEQYQRGTNALDRAKRPEESKPECRRREGRHAMTAARARAAGQEPPERRPLCFFDPRHGPPVRDVEWTPPWGSPRAVPACAADAQRIEDGLDPQTREVTVGGRQVPDWNAGPAYAPRAGGFYGGFGGSFRASCSGRCWEVVSASAATAGMETRATGISATGMSVAERLRWRRLRWRGHGRRRLLAGRRFGPLEDRIRLRG